MKLDLCCCELLFAKGLVLPAADLSLRSAGVWYDYHRLNSAFLFLFLSKLRLITVGLF